MSMSKQVTIPMETSAFYQDMSNLNIRFWQQDKGVAELRFLITRNNFPLPLSMENVNVILALESGESFIVTDDLDIVNEVEGVASFIIPQEFMAVATDVVGQIYVGTIDGDEVVVQRKFSFKVENDLLSSIPSEEKIRYIKMFDDLKVVMNERLGGVENAISLLEQNVLDVNTARDSAITQINDLFTAKTVTFDANYDAKFAELNGLISNTENYVTDAQADMVAKKAEFDEAVTGSGLVTEASATNWQKYKLTKDDGARTYLAKGSFVDVHALEPGYYETITADTPTQGFPTAFSNAAFVEIDITKSANGRKQLKVTQSSRPQTFVKYVHTDGADDNGWKEIPFINPADPFETVTGSQNKANTAENNAKVYADDKINEQHNVLFSGSVNGVNSTATLTSSMNNYEYIIVSGDCAGNDFSQIVIPSIVGSVFNMQNLNLRDSDGMLLGAYEVRLELTGTTIKITNDVAYDNPSDSGSGPNRNAYTITRVEGVHKK